LLLANRGAIAAEPEPISSSRPAAGRKDWGLMLEGYGPAFGLYFTIERDQRTINPGGGNASPMSSHFVLPPRDLASADDFLKLLHTWVPEADIETDGSNPTIVHIKEKSLASFPSYILDEKVTIQKVGTVGEYLDELFKRSNGLLAAQRDFGANEPLFDPKTPADVNMKDVSYRSAIDACVPRGRTHILWQAATILQLGKPITYLQLTGPMSMPALPVQAGRSSTTNSQPASTGASAPSGR
jgi:hypothetical protein